MLESHREAVVLSCSSMVTMRANHNSTLFGKCILGNVVGQIELISNFQILKDGDKVSASAAALLNKLNIRPFEYKMEVACGFCCCGDAALPVSRTNENPFHF